MIIEMIWLGLHGSLTLDTSQQHIQICSILDTNRSESDLSHVRLKPSYREPRSGIYPRVPESCVDLNNAVMRERRAYLAAHLTCHRCHGNIPSDTMQYIGASFD